MNVFVYKNSTGSMMKLHELKKLLDRLGYDMSPSSIINSILLSMNQVSQNRFKTTVKPYYDVRIIKRVTSVKIRNLGIFLGIVIIL